MERNVQENYLKAIYKLSEKNKEGAYTNDIAAELNIKPSSVSESLKKLSEAALINYEKYKAAKLTEKGKLIALMTIRKHRLWEVFLVEKLGFRWDEIHPMAEEMEHINFDELTERLAKFLDNPTADPHGDPIPDKHGRIKALKSKKLLEVKGKELVVMVGIENHSPDFMKHLDNIGLSLGANILVRSVVDFDNSMLISVNKSKDFYISKEVAENVLVKEN
jgi:DtxR family Mn-dependent transcriptional regulator